jgi:hypothetical protein
MTYKYLPFVLFFISFSASAEFINTFTNSNEKTWIDTTSIEGTGNIRRVHEMRNFRTQQIPKVGFEHLSKLHVYEFKCKEKTFKVLMTVAFEKHNGAGRPVFKDDIPTPTYTSVKPEGSVHKAMQITCK